jgi:hypothetical protein
MTLIITTTSICFRNAERRVFIVLLSVIVMNVVRLSVFMLNVIMLSVIMLKVVAPLIYLQRIQLYSCCSIFCVQVID